MTRFQKSEDMRLTCCRGVAGLALALGACSPAFAQTGAPAYPKPASFEAFRYADPAEEVAVARSAAPASISKDAEIMTLGPGGYETAVKGKNGFVCLVDRAWSKPFDDPEFWNPKMRGPECWNAIAARSVLPIFLERTRWVMAGLSKDDIALRTYTAIVAKTLSRPEPGNMVYMLGKQQYLSDGAAPHWHPHVMFYFATSSAPHWGANLPGAPVMKADDEAIDLTCFFVLAPKWSDGASAMEM